MGEVAREALRVGWSGTLISASSRDYGILFRSIATEISRRIFPIFGNFDLGLYASMLGE